MIFSITLFNIMTFSKQPLSITIFIITTLSIMGLVLLCRVSFILNVIYGKCCKPVFYAKCHYAECRYDESHYVENSFSLLLKWPAAVAW